MKRSLHALRIAILIIMVNMIFIKSFAQNETMPAGSFIINMGVTPQTINNGIRPYGLIWDIIKNNKAQVRWIISQTKAKDGIDFTYNGVDYKGGTFIIPKKYITPAVQAKINAVYPSVIVGTWTTTPFTVFVNYNLKYTPRWTFDFQNGSIALGYLDNAMIPTAEYPKKLPEQLNDCDDLFVMPHADPTWATHKNLKAWNLSSRGWIWAGCHAVSALENLYNPLDSTDQMNFLCQNFTGWGQDHTSTNGYAGNSLVLWNKHDNPENPFTYAYPNDPEMQFVGLADGGVGANGSEQAFMPYNPTSAGGAGLLAAWRPTTKIAISDASPASTNPNVPENSNGPIVEVAYGRAYGDNSRGEILYEAGHNHGGSSSAFVAAQRIFFNFSFMAVYDKDPIVVASGPTSLTAGASGNYSISLQMPGADLSNYYIDWSSSCGGTFSNKHGISTSYTPPPMGTCGPCMLTVTITDGCGREFYSTVDLNVTVCPVPPVALDRTNPIINNSPGTGPQPVAAITPPEGTDIDGVVVSYTVTSLPPASQGVLYYDNDNNTATPDILVPVNVALTAAQATSIKFDPADNFGGNAVFNYTVTDNSNLTDLTPATFTIPVNPPPVAQNIITAPISTVAKNALISPALNATDDGSIVSYTINVLPLATQGVLTLNDFPLTAGQKIKPSQGAELRFTPSGDYIGYPSFTYSATDDKNATDSTPATVTIQLINQTPKAKNISSPMLSFNNGNGHAAIPALVASDTDGVVASYKILTLPPPQEGVLFYRVSNSYYEVTGPMTLTGTQISQLKFDPAQGFTGVTKFKYTVTDDKGLVDNTPGIFSIPVGINPPVATDKTLTVYSGAAQAILSLAGTTPDATHPIVSYTIQSLPDPAQGVLYYNPGTPNTPVTVGTVLNPAVMPTLKFVPTTGGTGIATFEYTVTDNIGLTDQSPAVYTITLTNAAPATVNKTNTSISSTAGITNIMAMSATDADGYVASYMLTDLPDPADGEVMLNGNPVAAFQLLTVLQAGALQFKPVPGASGNAVFRYTAVDDQGAADLTPATFTIPLTFTNTKPIADNKTNPSFAVNAAAGSILPFTGSDADGTVNFYKVTNIPPAAKGTLYLNGVAVVKNQMIPAAMVNRLSFKPSGTSAGDASFTYSAFDNLNAESATDATYTIAVTNAAPVATAITIPAIKRGTTVNIPTLAGSDQDGTIASYKITGLATLGVLYVDLPGTGTYTLVTANQNLTPAQAGRIRIAPGSVNGTSTFTYTVTDNLGLVSASSATYTIPVSGTAALQPPLAADKVNAAINASAGATALLPLSATDLDGTVTNYIIKKIPAPYAGTLYFMKGGSTLTAIMIGGTYLTPTEATTLSFDPSGNYLGTVSFTYTALDDDYQPAATATATIPIVNTAPTAVNVTNSSITSGAGPTGISSLSGTDTDGTISTYTVMTLPGTDEGVLYLDGLPVSVGQTMTPVEAARLQFDPLASFIGNSKFTYTVTDNLDISAATAATFTIPVINQAPIAEDKVSQVITNPTGTGAQDLPAFTGIDYDGTVNSFVIKSLPNGGTLYVNGSAATVNQTVSLNQANQLTFDPNDGYSGITAFTYTAKDNSNATDATPASYRIEINMPPTSNNVNVAPLYAASPNTNIQALSGADDGFVQQYRITDLPSLTEGTLYINNTPVTDASQVAMLTLSQINQLSYASSSTFTGATLNYTDFDNLGLVDVTPSVYDIPQKIIISGNVWNDINGNTTVEAGEDKINGTNSGAGILAGTTLYVNLVNDLGTVVASTPVLANGDYSFPGAITNTKVTIQLSTNQGIVNAAKPATVIPAGWSTTGENTNGVNLPDLLPNSEILLTTTGTNVLTQNFGIEKLPESAFSTHGGTNPGLYNDATVDPSYFVINNVGNTPNTQDYHSGTITAMRITAFPTNVNTITINGTRYINGGTCPVSGTCTTWPAGGVTVPFTNGVGPSLPILVDPNDGTVTVRIPYAAIDNAGKEDPTPGYAELIYAFSVVAVRVESFNAAPKGNNVILTWNVSQETNIDHYEPEFSTNGINFTKLGNTPATGQHNYSMLHTSPVQGVNYYRLRIKELDGSTSLSDIKKVIFNRSGDISIFPNPARDVMNINFVGFMLDKGSTVRILNMEGKVMIIKQITSTNTYETVDISKLSSGTYIIQIESEGIISNKPLVKQ